MKKKKKVVEEEDSRSISTHYFSSSSSSSSFLLFLCVYNLPKREKEAQLSLSLLYGFFCIALVFVEAGALGRCVSLRFLLGNIKKRHTHIFEAQASMELAVLYSMQLHCFDNEFRSDTCTGGGPLATAPEKRFHNPSPLSETFFFFLLSRREIHTHTHNS